MTPREWSAGRASVMVLLAATFIVIGGPLRGLGFLVALLILASRPEEGGPSAMEAGAKAALRTVGTLLTSVGK